MKEFPVDLWPVVRNKKILVPAKTIDLTSQETFLGQVTKEKEVVPMNQAIR
jgi:hypothetical protein